MAAGEPDPQVRRSFWTRFGLILGVLVILGAVTGYSAAMLSRHHRTAHRPTPHHASGAMLVVSLVLLGVGMLLVLVGVGLRIRKHRRAGERRSMFNSPMMALTMRERRQLMRQVNGKAPADPAVLDITRDVASRIANQQVTPVIFVGAALYFLGNTLLNPSVGRAVTSGLYVLLALLVMPLARLPRRRANRFLSQNPLPATSVTTL